MAKKIKKCKGFNCLPCIRCKRQDDKAELLVEKLIEKNDRKYCEYFL